MFRRLLIAILIAYWLAMFVGTHAPSLGIKRGLLVNDKALHFLAYSGLAFLLIWVVSPRQRKRLAYLVVFTIAVVYAVVDELLQIPIPNRHAEIKDWLADVLGAAVGLAVYALLIRWRSAGEDDTSP